MLQVWCTSSRSAEGKGSQIELEPDEATLYNEANKRLFVCYFICSCRIFIAQLPARFFGPVWVHPLPLFISFYSAFSLSLAALSSVSCFASDSSLVPTISCIREPQTRAYRIRPDRTRTGQDRTGQNSAEPASGARWRQYDTAFRLPDSLARAEGKSAAGLKVGVIIYWHSTLMSETEEPNDSVETEVERRKLTLVLGKSTLVMAQNWDH